MGQPPQDQPHGQAVHVPVMLHECLHVLDPALLEHPAPVVVDATLGLGGHTEALLQRYPNVQVVGLDRDPYAVAAATARLAHFGPRFTVVHCVYDQLAQVLEQLGLHRVQGVLFDLGVSSLQIDTDARGFSYSRPTGLDMRMDATSGGISAEQVLATYPQEQLRRILATYGQERFAGRIAAAVVKARAQVALTSSQQLADLVRQSIPAAARRTGGNPAKRTFQALRIEVNDEMGALERALPQALEVLAPGGRVVVLTYHSLEDRIVKRALATAATSPLPVGVPVPHEHDVPLLRVVAKGQRPTVEEVDRNPRASSARLRAGEKLREAA